jgi:hypothetical protein
MKWLTNLIIIILIGLAVFGLWAKIFGIPDPWNSQINNIISLVMSTRTQ